jgi:hypothetical protein
MPTNILRDRNAAIRSGKPQAAGGRATRQPGPRRILIAAGRAKVRAELLDTPTADRVWRALPLHSSAEPWGQCIKFETPVETGRERTARQLVAPGDICFLVEEDRIIIAFGPTPISRPGELRLPRPCNVWAIALDDVGVLNGVRPGEKVSLTPAED